MLVHLLVCSAIVPALCSAMLHLSLHQPLATKTRIGLILDAVAAAERLKLPVLAQHVCNAASAWHMRREWHTG